MKQHINRSILPPAVLSIAGSDSGGGAGIQADLKTFSAHGLHGLTAIAALTAQNTRGVAAIHVPPTDFLAAQIDALFEDFRIEAVKIGMLADAQVIECVRERLVAHGVRNLVLDPVMVATSGAQLLRDDAVAALRTHLIPIAKVLTPNLPEAEILLGRPLHKGADLIAAARDLHRLGAACVLLKGGHGQDETIVDTCLDGDTCHQLEHPRLPLEAHGTGCTLSAAIASELALGQTAPNACRRAIGYVQGALHHAYRPGLGDVCVLAHDWRLHEHRCSG
ncbi:MAG: bifunctional hydroxymethylpyrimidine kinase/phosphomethylpyrimidine kinase [Lysobacteraceae bacterium]